MSDNDSGVRISVALALGMIKDKKSINKLEALAKSDKDEEVRRNAQYAIEKIQGAQKKPAGDDSELRTPSFREKSSVSTPRIVPLTEDERSTQAILKLTILTRIIEGNWNELVKIGAPAVEPLIKVLNGEFYRAVSAAETLARIGKPAVEPLIRALSDNNRNVRFLAAESLGKIKDPRAVEPLIKALSDMEWQVRNQVVLSLGSIKDPRAVEPLIAALGDKKLQPLGISSVAGALVQIGKPSVGPLTKVLSDNDKNVRLLVTIALGEIKDLNAIKALTERLGDEEESVRQAAQVAIEKIQKSNPKRSESRN